MKRSLFLLVLAFIPITTAGVNGTVTIARPDETVTMDGPCRAVPGVLVQYTQGSKAEVFLGLDCVPIFSDGFD